MPESAGLNRLQWEEKLAAIGEHLRSLRPYMQLVQPGIIEMPEHVPVEVGRWGTLTVITPPPAALAAMKLVRAEPKDIADVLFLCSRHGLDKEDVAHYARRIRDPQKRQTAEENLVYLETAR